MKKHIIYIFILSLFLFVSCKSEIDELFLAPDGSTEAKIEYLFSAAIKEPGAGLRLYYNPTAYYLVLRGISQWVQLTGNDSNDASMMELSYNGISGSWNAYYLNFMSKIAEMEILYNQLPEEQKSDYDIYINLGKILKAHATSKITDLYGDIPYSEAFSSRKSDQNIFPKFDEQKEIYKAMLEDLENASEFLETFSPNQSSVHKTLAKQDLLNKGDIDKWIRFANTVRLRLAMRISDADPALAKQIVNQVKDKPLVLANSQNILERAEAPDGLNRAEGGGYLARAFRGSGAQKTFAAEFMVNIMNNAKDPRRQYYFSVNGSGDYIGVPSSPDKIAPISGDINSTNYSKINPDLVLNNLYFPGIVVTASETNYLLAEAAMKNFINDDPKSYYDIAQRQSIEFYYQIISLNPDANPVQANSQDVQDFLNSSSFAYDGTIEQLATQKWIHFGVFQPNEAYADFRRFDYPKLPENFPVSGGGALQIPNRVIIPDSEKTKNEKNYDVVRAKDTPENKVWWDKN